MDVPPRDRLLQALGLNDALRTKRDVAFEEFARFGGGSAQLDEETFAVAVEQEWGVSRKAARACFDLKNSLLGGARNLEKEDYAIIRLAVLDQVTVTSMSR